MRHRDDESLKTPDCCQHPSINAQLIPRFSCLLPSTAISRHTLQGTSTEYAFCNTTTPCPRCPASSLGLTSGLNPTTSTLSLVPVSFSQERREEKREQTCLAVVNCESLTKRNPQVPQSFTRLPVSGTKTLPQYIPTVYPQTYQYYQYVQPAQTMAYRQPQLWYQAVGTPPRIVFTIVY